MSDTKDRSNDMSDKSSERINRCGSCSQHETIDHQQKKIDELEKRWNVLNGITKEIASDRKEFLEKLQAAEERIKELEGDIDPHCQVVRCCYNDYIEQVFEIAELEEENKILREAVEFYASEFKEMTLDGFNNDFYYEKARQALEKVRKK